MADAVISQARSGEGLVSGFGEQLMRLVQAELDWRAARRERLLLGRARLKADGPRLANLHWTEARKTHRKQIEELITLDWLQLRRNAFISGGRSLGKTWLASAIAREAAQSGCSVLFAPASRLLRQLNLALQAGELGRKLAQLNQYSLLVLDGAGDVGQDSHCAEMLLEVLDERADAHSTLLTSRLSREELNAWLVQHRVSTAVLDRLACTALLVEQPTRQR